MLYIKMYSKSGTCEKEWEKNGEKSDSFKSKRVKIPIFDFYGVYVVF